MIYAYFGTDEHKARAKAHAFISVVRKKRPDAPFFTVKPNEDSVARIEELAQGAGLFYEKQIVFVDQVYADPAIQTVFKDLLALMQQSDSIFIILEGNVRAPDKKMIETYAHEYHEFLLAEKKKVTFNIFALGDALLTRDKIKLWSLYLEALSIGKSPEEIHGSLFWQAKSMTLAAAENTASKTGLKPFVYTKAKTALKKYTLEEINSLPWSLIDTLHRSRLESEELSLAMERWVLSL